jgi:hypothetical protein
MTLKVIVDAKNQIIAVAHLPDVMPGQPPALSARPVLGPGHREFDLVIPDAHAARQPREHLRALHVDHKGDVRYRGDDPT